MSRMETHTMEFTRYPGDASELIQRVRVWEGRGWAVRQIAVVLPNRWVVVFERPQQEEVERT